MIIFREHIDKWASANNACHFLNQAEVKYQFHQILNIEISTIFRDFGPFIFMVPFFRVRSRFKCYKIGYQYFSLIILTFEYLSREWPTVGTGPKSHFFECQTFNIQK